MAGVALGAVGIERGFLEPRGSVARRWPVWVLLAALAFVVLGVLSTVAATAIATSGSASDLLLWGSLATMAFVASCAASSLALLARFLRFSGRQGRVPNSLRDNAYGIYLVHYPVASWLQLALLAAPLDALTKGVLVFIGAAGLSWGIVALMRRIPAAT